MMKKLHLLPALLLACNPLFSNSLVQEQATACIAENGSNQAALESCLSKLFVPASMDCDELLQVHRSVLTASTGRSNATVRAVARVSSKLAIISLSANCYSPDVAARLVARVGSEVGGDTTIIADATVSGAVDAAETLGVDSGSLANSASSGASTGDVPADSGGPAAGADPAAGATVYHDSRVIVSPSGTSGG